MRENSWWSRRVATLGVALLLASPMAHADYIAVGEIEGQVCTGFVIEHCRTVVIHAVKRDGELYRIATRYEEVSEYRDGRCWITVESRGGGLLSAAINSLLPNEFYTLTDDGEYEEVSPEYVTFRCTVE